MFIAYGPRQGSSPQRGDIFIAVASVNHNSSLPASTNALFVSTLFYQHARPETCHPAGVKNHLVGRKAINMSLLRSEDVPRRPELLSRNKKLLTCYAESYFAFFRPTALYDLCVSAPLWLS
jgi:hypothetical protein